MANTTTPEMFDTVLYGTISVTIVSLLSLGGAVIGPLLAADTQHRWLHFFLAMAVSTLSSDAILHIIPQVTGGHSHHHDEHEEHGDHEEHEITWLTITPERRTLLHLSVIVLSIYLLYFVEFFMFYRKTHLHFCSSPSKTENSPKTGALPTNSCSSLSSISIDRDNEENNNDAETQKSRRSVAGHELIRLSENTEDEGAEICGLKPRALIILFGDGIHNLVDGVAIGASYMLSVKLGLITTIAVVCHELPHEIGDLAVLIDSGLSTCRALVLNLLSALTAYIGLFVAIVLGKDEEMETILLAITAGMFLYVAWVDMLSHLKHHSLMVDHWMITALLQISGFTLGFLLIFSLGWFEHLLEH